MRVRLGGQRGSITEYVLIAIVIGLTALFVMAKFGSSVGGRFGAASNGVRAEIKGTEAEEALPSEIPSAESGPARGGSADAERSLDPAAPDGGRLEESGGEGKVQVGSLEFDLSTVLWLGLLVIVLGALMTLQVFRAAKREQRKKATRIGA